MVRDADSTTAPVTGPEAGEEPPRDAADRHVLARRSAPALIFGAGLVTLMNTVLSPLHNVNVAALRATGAVTVLASFAAPKLPWEKHSRLAGYGVMVSAIAALVATDRWHHYSRNEAAIAVYPIFFIIIIAWAGLTQPQGSASVVACLSGIALAWTLHNGGHGAAAWQCIAVTVPAAAILGETVSWAYGHALHLGRLDTQRRDALEALVSGASRLQGALTAKESESILLAIAANMFRGDDNRFEPADPRIDNGRERDDTHYDEATRQLFIRLRGQSGTLGTVITTMDQPDDFLLDAARLYSQHIGTRLEQLRVIDALTDAATHDTLTGIGNRRAAQASIETLQANDAVMILDIDHFKTVNDSLGHHAGDQVLAQFGEYLRDTTRPTDSVARYGGEEFLLVCRATTREQARQVANRLLDGWRAQRPLVTFSVGYAIHTSYDSAEVTLEHADMALYAAKREGRDRAHEYTHIGHAPTCPVAATQD